MSLDIVVAILNHSQKSYSRHEGNKVISTNTVEGYLSILKRGIYGTFHHVGRQHLHRYLSEFDFRYNARKVEDGDMTTLTVPGASGKNCEGSSSK